MNTNGIQIRTYHVILTRTAEVNEKLVPIAEELDFADFIKTTRRYKIYRKFSKVESEMLQNDTTKKKKNNSLPTELSNLKNTRPSNITVQS